MPLRKYSVTVQLIRTVDVLVIEGNAAEARKRVEDYGADLAINDFADVREHHQKCRITSVTREKS